MSAATLAVKDSPADLGLEPYRSSQVTSARFQHALRDGLTFHQAIRRRQFWSLYGMWLASQIVTSLYTQHVVLFALGQGISFILASVALGMIGFSSIIGRFATGVFLDRAGIGRALVLCYVASLLAGVVLLVTRDVAFLLLFALIFGLSFGGRSVIEVPIITNFFGLTQLAVIVGALETSFGVGGLIGPYLGGYAYDLTGGYSQVFLLCCLLSGISLVIAISLQRSVVAEG